MRALIMLIVLALWPAAANAQFGDPESSCKIEVDTLEFGTYSVVSHTPLTSSGRVDMRCGGNVISAEARVSLSTGSSGRFQKRTLLHGADRLNYNIYIDPARQVIAGDGTQGTSTLIPSTPHLLLKQFRGGLRATSQAVFRFYGKIDASQLVAAGEYNDTIQVIVEF